MLIASMLSFWTYSFPDGNGLMLLPDHNATPSAPEVIIITGYGSPDGAELAIKNGAWDFIEKPLDEKLDRAPLSTRPPVQGSKKKEDALL